MRVTTLVLRPSAPLETMAGLRSSYSCLYKVHPDKLGLAVARTIHIMYIYGRVSAEGRRTRVVDLGSKAHSRQPWTLSNRSLFEFSR